MSCASCSNCEPSEGVERAPSERAVKELQTALQAARAAFACRASVWREGDPAIVCVAHDGDEPDAAPPVSVRAAPGDTAEWKTRSGDARLVFGLGAQTKAWLVLGPGRGTRGQLEAYGSMLAPVCTHYLRAARELDRAAAELAERYEEINLLYAINEILGRTVALDEAARIILHELSDTVGAKRGALLVHDAANDQLVPVAAIGTEKDLAPIALDDTRAVAVRVFTTHAPMIAGRDRPGSEAESPVRRGEMLAVPILWTAPGGGEPPPLGVVLLSDRKTRTPFSAGDQKLVTAVATQIGTAIQNARLVRDSLNQERLLHELHLAHDLQMKMLPDTSLVAPVATVGARVEPAEDVGGDFYNLFRLGPNRTGAMVGDVSGHGYRAALIMALAMSASTIHAPRTTDPGEVLQLMFAALDEELERTEMYLSVFYGVVDRRAQTLRWANAGHPHAFIVDEDGEVERLGALDPPLGLGETFPRSKTRPWGSGKHLLVLFTDGVADARNRKDQRFGEDAVLEIVARNRKREPEDIVPEVFSAVKKHAGRAPLRDDRTLLILRS